MKLLIVILISFMFFGCLEEGTIVYDQDYPEAPENLGGSGSGADQRLLQIGTMQVEIAI